MKHPTYKRIAVCQEEVKQKMKKNEKKVKNNYVDNKKMYTEMVKYRAQYDAAMANGEIRPKLSNYIGKCIYDIAERLSMAGNFRNYPFREELVEDGIENAVAYAHNFNPDKYNNPFAYFTQIIYFSFIRRIDKEHKNLYIKYKAIEKFNLDAALSGQDYSETVVQSEGTIEKMNEFIRKYEEKRGLNQK